MAIYGCVFMAVAAWEGGPMGHRWPPWLGRHRWFLCVCELWFVRVRAKNLVPTHFIVEFGIVGSRGAS